MPNYVYRCPACLRSQEELIPLRLKDTYVVRCENCGRAMKKQITAPHVTNDGRGFPYVHHNLGVNPVTIHNKQQEQAEFKKRGLRDAR